MTHTVTYQEGEPTILRIKIREEPMSGRSVDCLTCKKKGISPLEIYQHLGHDLVESILTETKLKIVDDLDVVGFFMECGWQPLDALDRVISLKNQEVRK